MTADEIRRIRLVGQHVTQPAGMRTVVRDLCGVQAQFLSHAFHTLKIRSTDFSEERARRELVKSWTLRGTVHVFDPEDLALFLHQNRRRALRPCDTMESDGTVSAERKAFFADFIIKATRSGHGEREYLKEICRGAGMTPEEEESLFNPWGGLIRALCEEGSLCHQVQEKKAFQTCPAFDPMTEEEAELEMAQRYWRHFGPATIHDAAYFFGTTQRKAREWLEHLPVHAAMSGDQTYYWIDECPAPCEIPHCLFLGGFDQLMMGYEKRENPFLPLEHLRRIFNLAGIVMPPVLLDGVVKGRWKKSGKAVKVELFETASVHERQWIKEKAEEIWKDLSRIDID